MNTYVISSTLAVLAGFMAMSYRQYAEKYGWVIGSIFYEKKKWVSLFVWVCVIPGTIQLIYELSIIKGILMSVLLFFLAPVIIYILKTWAQIALIIIAILSALIWIIGGIAIVQINN